ncbi:MAG: methylmalonyl Co-A mutase-associated GTPase MeaB [bacterium]
MLRAPGGPAGELASQAAAGDRRAIGRLISRLEADDEGAADALSAMPQGKAYVIGVTGAPGTGKSTLVDRLIAEARRRGLSVGVVAVDPSSPFTGGAILGDRIRMQGHAGDRDVFIRSMGTRGALGGLSRHTLDAVRVLSAAGKDVVFVETVGVGQAEVDIARLADSVVVVLVPNLGDDVQSVKAGIMEIADVFVVNKSDLTGADKVASEVEANLMLAHPAPAPNGGDAWTPPILRTVAERGEGTGPLLDVLVKHRAWSEASGTWAQRRARRVREQVRLLLASDVVSHAFARDGTPRPQFAHLVAEAEAGRRSPGDAARAILVDYRTRTG